VLTDTHCHLTRAESDEPVEDVVARAHAQGVTSMITVGVDLASSVEAVQIASAHAGVRAAVGIHPHNAIEASDGVLERLARLATAPEAVAIGETGLDYFHDHSPRMRQEESLRAHLRLAKELDHAVILHNRQAHDDLVRVLLDETAPPRTVLHCFSGGVDLVQVCVEHGWFMSFAGNVTFSNADQLRDAAARVPLELLLAETDSPYLSPHPHRGKPNEPAGVRLVVEQLARLHGVEPAEMARITSDNAQRAFGWPQPAAWG
jgi:TatD DNase family protein